MISSDITQLSGSSLLGNPQPATVAVRSNMGNTAVVVADQPILSGTTPASFSEISLGGHSYGSVSRLNTKASNNLDANVNVRFRLQGGAFQNGIYTATAIVTCTDDSNP
jgi:hypothetical protein